MKDTYRERIKEEQKKLSPRQVFFSEGYRKLFRDLANEVAGEKLEQLLELGGIKKDVTFLVISGIAVICSLLKWNPLSFDMAWVAIVLCGIPIILEADDDDHQAEYDLLHDAQLHRDCSGNDGHTQPRRRRAGSQRRLGACDYKFRILTELRSKKARPFLKSLHFDCAHNFCPKGTKIPHLRGEQYVYPQGVRDIRKR